MTSIGKKVDRETFEGLIERYDNWGRWGDDDEIGSLNFRSAEGVVAAARLVRKGRVFSLALPLDRDGPLRDLPPRFNPIHLMTRDGGDVKRDHERGERGFQWVDDVITMPLQAATQWDALAHVFYDAKMYNGYPTDDVHSDGAERNAMTKAADRMVGRGVLLDVPRLTGRPWLEIDEAIEAEDLEQCCRTQGVDVGEGDFVAVRTGRLAAARDTGEWGPEFSAGAAAGLGVSTAEFFCDRNVAAVAVDTFSTEAIPHQTADAGIEGPLHVILVAYAGIHLGEFWDLDELAADCAEDGCWEFMLVAPPLTVTGAVGSPINPQAIK